MNFVVKISSPFANRHDFDRTRQHQSLSLTPSHKRKRRKEKSLKSTADMSPTARQIVLAMT
jgi:hypothetical protein